jgi:hypothetical protein
MPPKLIDLSHTVEEGMITYRGLSVPLICDYLTREASRKHYSGGTEFHSKFAMNNAQIFGIIQYNTT